MECALDIHAPCERGRAIEAADGFAVELAEPEAKLEHSGAIMNVEGGT